ncbi:MAG: iron-sulfur cluster assembly scaffold protein [Pyrinomonadaceae bacterium]|nr:iron-sulfur cluster assembly scaffold protein [Pyrinomonadaceae bacterium]
MIVIKATLAVERHTSSRSLVMSHYPGRIQDHFSQPRNVGEVDGADAVGEAGSVTCGAVLRLSLSIDAASQRIREAKFKAVGCGFLIASASAFTETIKELAISKAATLSEDAIINWFGGLPEERKLCAAMCREALRVALAQYHATRREEWTGDEALICTCFGVSEKSIERVIHTRSLRTVKQVTRACNAGGGCGSCRPLIQHILDDYWRTAAA